MRQIGVLPGSANPQTFTDHLLSLGVTSRAIEGRDGWAIWVHDENHLDKARGELAVYQADPTDPRFLMAAREAERVRKENAKLDRQYRGNVRDMKGRWQRIDARRRPLTMALLTTCIAVFLYCSLSVENFLRTFDTLGFFPDVIANLPVASQLGLVAIEHGQVWRLVTPIFIHLSLSHILFNMWALIQVGSIIEYRLGTFTLSVLVLVSAILSNLGQYVYVINFYNNLNQFGGFSGVGYALFGYIWMKGVYHPEGGLILHPTTVRIMLLWLLLGFAGFLNMANGAHLAGLAVGMLFGIAGF